MRIPAAVIALCLLVLAAMHAAAVAPGNPAFQARWERTDDPVLSGRIARTWIWGPQANTQVMNESYQESPGGTRQVQYYDKSRMEINNPDGNPDDLFYVTNGLLVVELMSGNLQLGDAKFEQHNPALVNVAGDSDDPTGPTYATMALLRNLPPVPDGAIITQRVDRAGVVTNDQALAAQNIRAVSRLTVPGIDHQIAAPFWEFMNSSGLVKVDGQYVNEALFTNPYYATGFPITEAYWARVKVANTFKDVLMQCFERRCLTYTPGNPPGFDTEAGNVGQHYHTWRYVQIPAEGSPTATATATRTTDPGATATSTGAITATSTGVVSPSATGTGVPSATSTGVASATSTGVASATSTGVASPTATGVAGPTYEYVSKFGRGTDPSLQLQLVYGVARDAANNVYVVSATQNKVLKFDGNGKYLTQWGSQGDDPSQFNRPWAIAIDSAGNVYVSEKDGNRIQKFDSNGQYLATFGLGQGSGDGQLNAPLGIALNANGNLYVADSGNHRIQVFDIDGDYLNEWGSLGTGFSQFNEPMGITIAGEFVYVADTNNNRVQVFGVDGQYLYEWGSLGDENGELSLPSGIVLNPERTRVYVSEWGNDRIQVFDTSGNWKATWGSPGTSLSQFDNPTQLTFDARGYLLVADANNARVLMLVTGNGRYLAQINGDSHATFSAIDGLALLPAGLLAVADYDAHQVEQFATDGKHGFEYGPELYGNALPLGAVSDVAFDATSQMYVADTGNNRVVVVMLPGNVPQVLGGPGTDPGKFFLPTGISLDPAGNIYVVDSSNHRIQKFDSSLNFVTMWGALGTSQGQFGAPYGIYATATRVYVTDQADRKVQVYSSTGTFLFEFGSQGAGNGQFENLRRITGDASGFIYVTADDRVQKFTAEGVYVTSFGTSGSGNGQLLSPSGIAVGSDGKVYVADSGNDRVQVFAPVLEEIP